MQKTLSSVCCAFFLVLVFTAPTAFAQCDCDFVIPLSAWQVDGNTLKGVNGQVGVKPGDKVCFASGVRADISFYNFKGALGNPIIVTNMCDGLATVKGLTAGTGRLMYMGNCSYIRVTGTGNPSIQYGIEMTVGVQAIDFRDLSTDVEADHIYVHDIGYSAFNAKTDPSCDPLTWRGAFTMRNVSFHDNKVSNIGGEGIYIGESHFNTTVPVVCNGITLQAMEHEVIGAKVYNNIFENTGRDAIQVGAVTSGGEIHHNKITNFGTTNEYGQQSGIQINPGTNAEIYNNVIDTGTGFGLFAGGRGGSHVYNNIIMNCRQGGIICADYAPLDPSGFIFANNTLINNQAYGGIYMLSENTLANQWVNNIIVSPSSVKAVYLNNPNKIKWNASNNIETNDINSVKFVNGAGKDLHLQATSPAVNAGKDMRAYGITLDLDNLARPQGGAADIGAYEMSGGGTNPTPVANAGGNKTVTLPTSSTALAGSASDSGGGTITSYAWTKVAGANCTMANADKATMSVSDLAAGSYRFKLTVKDNAGASASDEAQVTVASPTAGTNIAPVANAGADRTVGLPLTSLSLNGSATDADGTVTYWEWTKVSGGLLTLLDIGKPTLLLSVLLPGTYVFRLKVTDDKGAVGTDDVTITINPLATNTPPVANAGADKAITLPTNSTTLTGGGTDANGTITTYAWTKVAGGAATLTNANTATLGLSALVAGTYTFRLTITDNNGATASDDVVLTVNPAASTGNTAPVANAGADKTITLPTNSLSIAGSGTDADGTVMYWEWTKVAGGAATLANAGTATLSLTGLVAGTYTFRLKITDNKGAVGTDDVIVTVNAATVSNKAPVANADADKAITLPTSSTTLTGTGTDSDGTITYYAWTKVAGGAATLTNAGTATVSLSGLVAGSYTFRLTVTDNDGATASDDVILTVNPASTANVAPVANAGADKTVTLPSNSLSIAGSGTDADGTVMYWEWTKVAGGAATLANVGTATLSVSGLVAGTYTFRLKITDNKGAVGTDDVIVTVNAAPVSNQAPVANAGTDKTITLPANSTTLTGSGTDSDGTITYYAWTKIAGGAATMTNAGTATVSLSELVAGSYTFRLTVTDNAGATASDDVILTVNPASTANLAPVANAGADKTITLPTNSLSLAGSGTDADGTVLYWEWTKVAGGAATLANAGTASLSVSGLVAGTYTFRLKITDNKGATGTDDVIVTVNAASTANSAPFANAGADQTITLPTASLTIYGNGSDADGTIMYWEWTKVAGGAATLANAGTSALSISGLAAGSYTFRLKVTDNKGAMGTDDVVVTVNAAAATKPPTGNAAPVANAGVDQTITLPTATTTLWGGGTDADGTVMYWEWIKVSGGNAVMTDVGKPTCQISGMASGTYVFRLRITDNLGATGIDEITVMVKDAATTSARAATPDYTSLAEPVADLQGPSADYTASASVEDFVFLDKQFPGGREYTVMIYDPNGKRLYAGAWSADLYDSVFPVSGFYVYHILTGGVKVDGGKVYVTQ